MNTEFYIDLVRRAFAEEEWKFLSKDSTVQEKLRSIVDIDDAEHAISLGRKILRMHGKFGEETK